MCRHKHFVFNRFNYHYQCVNCLVLFDTMTTDVPVEENRGVNILSRLRGYQGSQPN